MRFKSFKATKGHCEIVHKELEYSTVGLQPVWGRPNNRWDGRKMVRFERSGVDSTLVHYRDAVDGVSGSLQGTAQQRRMEEWMDGISSKQLLVEHEIMRKMSIHSPTIVPVDLCSHFSFRFCTCIKEYSCSNIS